MMKAFFHIEKKKDLVGDAIAPAQRHGLVGLAAYVTTAAGQVCWRVYGTSSALLAQANSAQVGTLRNLNIKFKKNTNFVELFQNSRIIFCFEQSQMKID